MTAETRTFRILDGRATAAAIREEVKLGSAELLERHGVVPGLTVVLVGDDPASQIYVRNKAKAAVKAGMCSEIERLPASATEEQLLDTVRRLGADSSVHGILVQLPLPDHIDEEEILGAISLEKDVDGFHPINIGRLSMKRRDPLFSPCTPNGCIELLDRTGVEIEGKRAVVLGRSNIVGLPVAMLLLHRNATLTICHSRTKDLPGVVREADILIAAVGQPEMVRGDWVKPGVVVIDVGVNAVDDATREKGYRLVGDVAFDEVKEVAAAITPVPGGVGPMTIAMLLRNTLSSAKRSLGMN